MAKDMLHRSSRLSKNLSTFATLYSTLPVEPASRSTPEFAAFTATLGAFAELGEKLSQYQTEDE
jgi:hypothetical protein